MPRANRVFLPGQIWHITHRCHKQEFLLKFARDRERWLYWLFEAKKRYGLCVLNYIVTCNHIHLLVKDTGESVISKSLQLVAGRTAQDYNNRKNRKGAYWEDRYHATAISDDEHLLRCLVYIDLNMVRAGVIGHPNQWRHSGYREIQSPPKRYRIIDLKVLMDYCGAAQFADLQARHKEWVEEELKNGMLKRDETWTRSVAIGSEPFVLRVHNALRAKLKIKSSAD